MSQLPDKWAVQIQSEAEARELQGLQRESPDSFAGYEPIIECTLALINFGVNACLNCGGKESTQWTYQSNHWYTKHGYTILSIDQLKELLK